MALPYRLRLPGPTPVPDPVQQAIAGPVVNHHGPEFRKTFGRVEELIQPILGTTNPVVFLASSGTGMMEASLVNILDTSDRVLLCVNGQFSERYAAIAAALGANVDVMDLEWGRALDPAEIEDRMRAADYHAVVVVHNESSTGVVSDLAAIGKIVSATPALFVVDSVSGVAGIEMKQDEWGIDVLVTSSQKCLMCPPGVGLASISPKALPVVNRDNRMPRFYWDFRKYISGIARGETPFTAPVSLVTGLEKALEMIHAEGLSNVLARHLRMSAEMRKGCAALGLHPFGDPDALSPTVVALSVPEGLNGNDIVKGLYDRFHTVIAGSRNRLNGKVIRIGTMGHCHDEDVRLDLQYLAEVVHELKTPSARRAELIADV